jgi:integrase
VRVEDVHLAQARLQLLRTKGRRPRDAWLHPAAVDALARWLEVRGQAPGPLFVPLSRTGRPLLEHGELSTHQVRKIVKARAAEAGREATTHDLRRFVVGALLDHHDVALVAKVVGHRDPRTTAGYDHRPKARQRDAVAGLRLPKLPGGLGDASTPTRAAPASVAGR